MEYVDIDGTKKRPYIIHRSSIGCYERTLALLIEKYAGAFPLWLSPEQVRILPIADRHVEYADKLFNQLKNLGFRCSVDDRAENVKKKIRDAQLEKLPYMLVLGDKEVETNTVSLRYRSGKTETLSVEDLISKLVYERDNKVR